ncbi:MAG: hypothetical protein ACYC8T_37410 [Myxococcaceae bacterium]
MFKLGLDLELGYRTRERSSIGLAIPFSIGFTSVSMLGTQSTVNLFELPLTFRWALHFGPRLRARFDAGLGWVQYSLTYTAPFVGPQSIGYGGVALRTAAAVEWTPIDQVAIFIEPLAMPLHFVTMTVGSSSYSSVNLLYSTTAGALYRF